MNFLLAASQKFTILPEGNTCDSEMSKLRNKKSGSMITN